jgi:plastin-1
MYKIETMDLARILSAEESLANVPPEQILLRWFNAHLKSAGHPRTVTNFSQDIMVRFFFCCF